MTSPPGGQLLDLSPSPTMASLPGSWLLENSGGSTPNHPSGEDSSRGQSLVVEGYDETELDKVLTPLVNSLCEGVGSSRWLREKRHGAKTNGVRLLKLHDRDRHLQMMYSFIPSMKDYLEEKLVDTQHSIRSVANDLMAAEARSMPSATPFLFPSSGGLENFAKCAAEYMLSCADSQTPEINSLRKRFHDLTEVSLRIQRSLHLLQYASVWVMKKRDTLSHEILKQEEALKNSLLGPGSLSRHGLLPMDVVDVIQSFLPEALTTQPLTTGDLDVLQLENRHSVYDLDIRHTSVGQVTQVRQAQEIQRFNLAIHADTTRPEFRIFDDNEDDNDVHNFDDTAKLEEFIEKLVIVSELTTQIKSFNFQLVTASNTCMPLLTAAARSFWYSEDLTVETSISRTGLNIELEDDTLSEIQDILVAAPHAGSLRPPRRAKLTRPLLQPFVDAGLLASVTHLTLTESASLAVKYIPQMVVADLPSLRSLDLYNIREDPAQLLIHLGSISVLRVPSLSFITRCSPMNEVRCLGVRLDDCEVGYSVFEGTESFLPLIAGTFPDLVELEACPVLLDALARTGNGDIGLLPALRSLHIGLWQRISGNENWHLNETLESAVKIATKRKDSESLESIQTVVVCGSSWGRLAPHSHEMDELVPEVTYRTSDCQCQSLGDTE